MTTAQKRVCVIGGVVSGLVAIKELLAEGHVPVCFEAAATFGEVFAPEGVESRRIYENLRLTIAITYMAFSDFPPLPGDAYRYWTAVEYFNYVQAYAAYFDLLRHIQFNTRVVSVSKLQNGEGPVNWHVRCDNGIESTFDAVAVFCGTHQAGRDLTANYPSLMHFKGQVSTP